MSEWDCEHGVTDDAQTPCPLCSRDRRIAALSKSHADITACAADLERDHSALMDSYKEMSDRAFAAEGRVAELERLRTEKQIIHARTVDERDAEIENLKRALAEAKRQASGYYDEAHDAIQKRKASEAECERLRGALRVVADWRLPSTGKFWDAERTRPTSYETEYGSAGARDYIRFIARTALENTDGH